MELLKTSIELGKSPINTSPSKYTFTFSKSQRFPSTKDGQAQPNLYSPKNVANYRSAGIGYGNKYPISRDKKEFKTPSPSQYNVKYGFDKIKKNNGIIFGVSRDKSKNVRI